MDNDDTPTTEEPTNIISLVAKKNEVKEQSAKKEDFPISTYRIVYRDGSLVEVDGFLFVSPDLATFLNKEQIIEFTAPFDLVGSITRVLPSGELAVRVLSE